MKLMLQIEMFMVTLLAVPSFALKAGSIGGGVQGQKVLKNPDFGSAFRSDTTLRFMRRLHSHEAVESKVDSEAARTQACTQHGFKAAERAGCVAFMRQACHESTHVVEKREVSKESCTHFFQEEQPGYGGGKAKEQSKSDKPKEEESQSALFPTDLKDLQQGPQYNSKKAQKAAADVADGQDEQKENQEPRPPLDAPDSLQHGPQYESKKAQKGTDKAADERKKAGPREGGGFSEALKPFGKLFKEAQKGPNYHKNLPQDKEEPEEKEVPSVPGCRNSPKGWADTKERDCEDYAEGEWCTRHGGYGDAWLDEWGTFEEVANKGKSAKEACCVCGGGQRKGEEPSEKPSKSSGSDAPAKPPAAPKAPILGTKSGRALQEQGYSGDLVAHEDQVTMTSDWGREFGPHAGHRDIKTICLETPGNEWCELHGYYDKPRSAASMKSVAAVLVALLFACLR